jgi:hypothetical protein
MNRRRLGILLLVVAAVAVSVGAWRGWRREMGRRLDEGLKSARADAERGRFALARKTLEGLQSAHRDDGRIALALGEARASAGALDDAERAWAGIPADSPYAAQGAHRRADLAMHLLGRLARAESVLEAALPNASGPDAFAIRLLLNRLYRWEGRIDRVVAMTEANWADAPNPRSELKDLATIDLGTWPVDGVRQVPGEVRGQGPRRRPRLARLGEPGDPARRPGRSPQTPRSLPRGPARRPPPPGIPPWTWPWPRATWPRPAWRPCGSRNSGRGSPRTDSIGSSPGPSGSGAIRGRRGAAIARPPPWRNSAGSSRGTWPRWSG